MLCTKQNKRKIIFINFSIFFIIFKLLNKTDELRLYVSVYFVLLNIKKKANA